MSGWPGERCGVHSANMRGACGDRATIRWKTPDGYRYSCMSHHPWNPPYPLECWQPGAWVPFTVATLMPEEPKSEAPPA